MGLKRDVDHEEPMFFQKQLSQNLGNHDFEIALRELGQYGVETSKLTDDILDTVRRHQREFDGRGIPAMRYHDALLGLQRKIEESFQNVKLFMAQQQKQAEDERMRGDDKRGEYGDDDRWGIDKDPSFHGGSDAKKIRRGVS